jgi:sugar lactone lactonase YvrE
MDNIGKPENVRGKNGKGTRWALSRNVRLSLSIVVLIAGITPVFAFADEPGLPSELSQGLLEESTDNSAPLETPITDPRAAEELPHENLGREGAVELTEAVFGLILEDAAGPVQGIKVQKYLGDNAAIVPGAPSADSPVEIFGGSSDEQGEVASEKSVLLESTLPLRAESPGGTKEPVDLSLERSGDKLEPKTAVVEVELPQEIGDGIQLPQVGIGIGVDDVPSSRAPSIINETVATYPNIAVDTDFSVSPTPTGFETMTTLRSPDAPHSQILELDIPSGATLKQVDEGAEVTRDGKTILKVLAPSAIDASGADVPVSLDVEGSSLALTVSPDASTNFPVLVDPLFEAYDWYYFQAQTGQATWHSTTNAAGMETSRNTSGLFLTARREFFYTNGSQANWWYYVPRLQQEEALGRKPTSFLQHMTLWHMAFVTEPGGAYSPYVVAGILGSSGWAGKPGGQAVWTYWGNGPTFYMNSPGNGTLVAFENGEPGNRDRSAKGGEIAIASLENTVQTQTSRLAAVGAAAVEVGDEDNPLTKYGSILPWVNQTATAPITATGEDTGLGMKNITFEFPSKELKTVSNPCLGTSESSCPLLWTASLPATQYSPAGMPQGFNYIPFIAEDPLGNKSAPGGEALIKVDHTSPTLGLSGSITEQAALGTSASQYALKYNSTDGETTVAAAGTPFGQVGTTEGKMELPVGVALDPAGSIFVVDRTNSRVEKFNSAGIFQSQFGNSGKAVLSGPSGIAIDAQKNVWVADTNNNRIVKFNEKGEFVAMYGREVNKTLMGGMGQGTNECTAASGYVCQAGLPTNELGGFKEPRGVAVTSGGNVLVADTGNNRILKLSSSGELLARGGTLGSAAGQLSAPFGLAVAPDGAIWIADTGNNRIQKWSSTFEYLLQSGSAGTGPGQFQSPAAIAVTSAGHPVVSDGAGNRVEVFQTNGAFLKKFGAAGSGSAQFSEPRGIAIEGGGSIVVADAKNHRITRWTHPDYDAQAGVNKVEVKVDGGTPKVLYNQACATNSCSVSNEWLYKANEYTTGSHTLEVIARDGVTAPTTKTLAINSINDAAAPQLSATSAFFNAPDGWLEQKSYSYNASATDIGGSGVKALSLKIDGKVVKNVTQSCPNGGCSAALGSSTIDMTAYSGGSHPAELIATDVANRVAVKSWTINVNPKGVVPVGETTDTLEAFENTTEELEPVATTSEFLEPAIIQAGDNPGFEKVSGTLKSTGTPASTSINIATEAVTVEGAEGAISMAPVGAGSSIDAGVEGGVAAVTPSVAGGVDTVVRPEYNGALFFTDIRQPTSTDHFTWHMSLQSGQSIRPVDDQAAEVIFEDGHEMGLISAMPAHDATGAAVPTHIEIDGTNVTLVVSHKAGSYVYPVVAGQSFEVGYSSVEVIEPPVILEEEPGVGAFPPEDPDFVENQELANPLTPFEKSQLQLWSQSDRGKALTRKQARRLLRRRKTKFWVPAPGWRSGGEVVNTFFIEGKDCNVDSCGAWEIAFDGGSFVRGLKYSEWNKTDEVECHGHVDWYWALNIEALSLNAGEVGPRKVWKGGSDHLTGYCHYELRVGPIPELGWAAGTRAMQVWVFPNGYQQLYMRSWDPPGPEIQEA